MRPGCSWDPRTCSRSTGAALRCRLVQQQPAGALQTLATTAARCGLQGVEDNGHPAGLPPAELDASLAVLARMAAEVGARAEVLQVRGGLRCWRGLQAGCCARCESPAGLLALG